MIKDFVLQLALKAPHISEVQETYFGFVPGSNDVKSNNYYAQKLELAVLGTVSQSFDQFIVEEALLYIKQTKIGDRSIRLIFFPIQVYDTESHESYTKMIKQFFLLNAFLQRSSTLKTKVICLSYVKPTSSGPQSGDHDYAFLTHIRDTFSLAKENFKIQSKVQNFKETLTKMVYVLITKSPTAQVQSIDEPNPDSQPQQKKEITLLNDCFVMTNDNRMYKLLPFNKKLILHEAPQTLFQTDNFIDIIEYQKLFNFNKFIHCKPKIYADNNFDTKIVDQFWGIIQSIVYPLYNVKIALAKKYSLAVTDDKPWASEHIEKDLQTFNVKFGFNLWASNRNNFHPPRKPQASSQIGESLLSQYTRDFKKYSKFQNQHETFIHAMLLDHINKVGFEVEKLKNSIKVCTDKKSQFKLQKKLLQVTKIIINLLKNLKIHSPFVLMLQNFEAQFYQQITELYLGAYEDLCLAYQYHFSKTTDLSIKLQSLKSSKKDILTVIMSVNNFTEMLSNTEKAPEEQLQAKKEMLYLLMRLIEDNKPVEKDRDVIVKLYNTKYELGSTYHKSAILEGDQNGEELKQALEIMFVHLYKNIFQDPKNLEEYGSRVIFNQQDLLQKISSILLLLGHTNLSIQIQKKLNNPIIVENLYNRLIMQYPRYSPQLLRVIGQAIQYFTKKFQQENVKFYYNLAMKNVHASQRQEWEKKKFDFVEKCGVQDQRKIALRNARGYEVQLDKLFVGKVLGVLGKGN